MASRHLRQYINAEQKEDICDLSEESDSSEKGEIENISHNIYSLLLSDDDNDDIENEKEEKSNLSIDINNHNSISQLYDSTDIHSRKKKKKKKNKKSSSNKIFSNENSSDFFDNKDIDLIKLRNRKQNNEKEEQESSGLFPLIPLTFDTILLCQKSRFNPLVETSRRFGRKALKNINSSTSHSSSSHTQSPYNHHITKGSIFIYPLNYWKRMPPSMIILDFQATLSHNINIYSLQFSPQYQLIQDEFSQYLSLYDFDNLLHFHQKYPFHIDVLLILSDYFFHHDDLKMAAEFTSQALYLYETAFASSSLTNPHEYLPYFNLLSPYYRIITSGNANHSYYCSLYRHLYYLGRQGLYITALEFAKYGFIIDNDEKYHFIIPLLYFSLCAHEYVFLQNLILSQNLNKEYSISTLPLALYSIFLSAYHLYPSSRDIFLEFESFPLNIVDFIHQYYLLLNSNSPFLSSFTLFYSILLFPHFIQLFIKDYSSISSHHLFQSLYNHNSIDHLVVIFNKMFSRFFNDEIIKYILLHCEILLEKINDHSIIISPYHKLSLSLCSTALASYSTTITNDIILYPTLYPTTSRYVFQNSTNNVTMNLHDTNILTGFFLSFLPWIHIENITEPLE